MKVTHRFFIWILVFGALFLTACSPDPVTLPISDSQIVSAGSSFGQSFTAEYDGLSGISVLLEPSEFLTSGSLIFHLRENSQSQNEIAKARLPLIEVAHKDYYKFDFSPIVDSRRKDYFLEVEVEEGGEVEIFFAESDSYLDGALYFNRIPQEAQLGFRLEYDQKDYLRGLSQFAATWLIMLGVGFFSLILPGWGLLSLLWRGWDDFIWPVKLGLSCGVSLAIYPLLFLWTDLVGIHLGPVYAWLPPFIGLLILVWKNRRRFSQAQKSSRGKYRIYWDDIKTKPGFVITDAAFVIIIVLLVISRFWVIKSLDIPLYGDSYQHTMMVQLIIDHGGLFDSWEPYANLTSFTYHYGFHSAVAIYHWISGLSAETAVLWAGQLLNICAILSLYPLAFKLTKNRWAGVITMLVAGLLSPMPMGYVNWGRYTQLAGQVILSTSIWINWSLLEKTSAGWQDTSWVKRLSNWRNLGFTLGSLIITWILIGGIAVTHYRVLILFILFFPAYLIITFSNKNNLLQVVRIIWIGIGGIILSTPWLFQILGGRLVKGFILQITTMQSAALSSSDTLQGFANLQNYLPILIWILFILCIGWSLWKQKKDSAVLSLWWFIIILATNPAWIGLPGSGVISNFAMLIAFYIPGSLVIASTIVWILPRDQQTFEINDQKYTNKINKFVFPGVMLLITCVLGFWGLKNRINDLNISRYELVTRPDLRAMKWIRENTDQDDAFLVNSFFAYNDSLAVGSDGGWWIPLLAGRKTTLPPLTYGIEEGTQINDFQEINDINRKVLTYGINNPDVISMLKEKGIKYIYIGQRQGTVNNNGPKILDPQVMIKNPNIDVKYNQDRVWIFELLP